MAVACCTMSLPNAQRAQVERTKLVAYLLADHHPQNGGKAAWFNALGYSLESWRHLALEFRRLAVEASLVGEDPTPHGRKYIQEGFILSATARQKGLEYGIRMVWIIEHGTDVPRLITAYPGEGASHDA